MKILINIDEKQLEVDGQCPVLELEARIKNILGDDRLDWQICMSSYSGKGNSALKEISAISHDKFAELVQQHPTEDPTEVEDIPTNENVSQGIDALERLKEMTILPDPQTPKDKVDLKEWVSPHRSGLQTIGYVDPDFQQSVNRATIEPTYKGKPISQLDDKDKQEMAVKIVDDINLNTSDNEDRT